LTGEDEHRGSGAASFAWFVPRDGYAWRRDFESVPLKATATRLASVGPWLTEPAPVGTAVEGRWYNPCKWEPDLHATFGNLPIGDDDAALDKLAAFASKYGRLGVDTVTVAPVGRERTRPVYLAEHLATWLSALSDVGGLLTLAAAYRGATTGRTENLASLREWIRWDNDARRVRLVFTWPGAPSAASHVIAREAPRERAREALDAWRRDRSEHGRYIAPLQRFLNERVNARLRQHVAPRVTVGAETPAGGGSVVLMPDSLLGAMYLLLAEDAGGVRAPKVCRACGKFFPPVRSDQETCGSACRQRLYRTRKAKRPKGGSQ